jgi:hypothetical protein
MISWAATLSSTKRVLLVKVAAEAVVADRVAVAMAAVEAGDRVVVEAGDLAEAVAVAGRVAVVGVGEAAAGTVAIAAVTVVAVAAGAGKSLPQSRLKMKPGSPPTRTPRFFL